MHITARHVLPPKFEVASAIGRPATRAPVPRPLAAIVLASLLLPAACSRNAPQAPGAATAGDIASRTYLARPWVLDPAAGSAQPDLVATARGTLLLTWISSETGRRPALMFSAFDGATWLQSSRTIAVGTALFANWADTPHLSATADGAYWVHWLQKNPAAAGASDVLLSRSLSNGRSWSAPILVNDDGTPTEHGFVSLWPQGESSLGVAWLDGRETTPAAAAPVSAAAAGADPNAGADAVGTAGSAGSHAAMGHGAMGHGAAMPAAHAWPTGPMTLRAALFDNTLQRSQERQLDADTCNCCQTDVAVTGMGALLAWRGRTDGEVRDILTARFDGKAWTRPAIVHADGWVTAGCPVNGPAIAARDHTAVVAWYTAANDVPAVRIARSVDAGAHFAAPVTVEQGAAVLGRVDVAFDGAQAWVLWLDEDASGQRLRLARYSADLSRRYQLIELATLTGRGSATGYAKLALFGNDAYVVWTDVIAGRPRLQGAVLSAR